jgi:hypothetical protein
MLTSTESENMFCFVFAPEDFFLLNRNFIPENIWKKQKDLPLLLVNKLLWKSIEIN